MDEQSIIRARSGIHQLLKIHGAGEYRFGRSEFSSGSSVRSGSGGAERRDSEQPLKLIASFPGKEQRTNELRGARDAPCRAVPGHRNRNGGRGVEWAVTTRTRAESSSFPHAAGEARRGAMSATSSEAWLADRAGAVSPSRV